MRAAIKRRIWRTLAATLGTVVVLGVVVHLPPVRGYLAAHGHHGGGLCPLGYGRPAGVATIVHDPSAPRAKARPAIGFALGTTTAAELTTWALAHRVACATRHGGASVECADVPAELLPRDAGALGVTTAWFEFDRRGTLASVRTVRRDRDVGAVATAFATIRDQLTARAGVPAAEDGSAAPAVLANGALRQAMVAYEFADYHAVVRATNMGDGFVLSEEYVAL